MTFLNYCLIFFSGDCKRMLKGTITDPENVAELEKLFDFDLNKKKVRAIFR